jgi:glycosidase
MARWVSEVLEEYPAFYIVGEVWFENIATTAYWQKGTINRDGYKSTLPSVTDFPLCFSIPKALNEAASWDAGMRRLYNVLTQDFIYPDPNNNLIFLDNHDMTRIYLSLQRDIKKLKMALTFLLTVRGIPEIYYGTELLMDGDGAHHPNVRKDFPGGWSGDQANAFTAGGRTAEQNEIFDYLKNLLQWRKSASVIHSGKLTHFIPDDNVYVYFRHDQNNVVMVVLNANNAHKKLNTAKFSELLQPFKSARNIHTQQSISNLSEISLQPMEAMILQLQ